MTDDAVTHKRELGRERSKRHRYLVTLYGKGGYLRTPRVTPIDYLEKLGHRWRHIREAIEGGDPKKLEGCLTRSKQRLPTID